MSTLPQDVHPESGFRLPLPRLEDMDDYGRKVFDQVVGPKSHSIVGLRGPSGIWLHSPRVAELQKALNEYLRFESGLSTQICELAILVTACEMDSQFEWAAHEQRAIKEGLSQETVDAVRYRREVAHLPETERVVIEFGRELFRQKKVTSETFASASRLFGRKNLVDLVVLMSSYASTALDLRAFDMQLGPDKKPLLP